MIFLLLLYSCCLGTGIALERRLDFESLLQRVVVIFTAAAAQLVVSVQVLSLVGRLTANWLLLANAAFLIAALLLVRLDLLPHRTTWSELLTRAQSEIFSGRPSLWGWAMIGLAGASMACRCLLSVPMIPFGDIYHFEMPLYWIQNRSIAPFPVNNPRITAVSFLGEALAFPGYLYAHSGIAFVLLTCFAGLAVLGLVYALARRLGCGVDASLAAAAVTVGLPDFAMTLLSAGASLYLNVLWAAASVLFLLDSRPAGPVTTKNLAAVGCSIVLFLMACGSKNSLALAGPFFLVAVWLVFRQNLWGGRVIRVTVLSGILGLLCSGVAWNYAANRAWFGSFGGPPFLHSYVANDFHPRAIWTRLLRGTALLTGDTLYLPRNVRQNYARTLAAAVSSLGGVKDLREDDEGFRFDEATITPLKGLGLVGLGCLLPGAALGLWRCLRRGSHLNGGAEITATRVLLLLAGGCFLTGHVFFRWQSLGLMRLIPACGLFLAPLSGLMFKRGSARLFALLLLSGSCVFFFVHDLSLLGRRVESGQTLVFRCIYRFTNDHSSWVEYTTEDGGRRDLQLKEDYTQREILLALMKSIPPGSIIAFSGDVNFESYYLFGRRFENQLIPLCDCRNPDQLLEPGPEVQYLVFAPCSPTQKAWATERGFRAVFDTTDKAHRVITAFRREQR